jgi:soluble lytic murein transglycosylase-like protein
VWGDADLVPSAGQRFELLSTISSTMPPRAARGAAFLFALALALVRAPAPARADPDPGAGQAVDAGANDAAAGAPAADVPALITDAAVRHGVDADRLLRIGWCESRWDPSARGAGGAAGVFQFVPSTWSWASAGAGFPGASVFDPFANVETAAWLMSTQGAGHWRCR